MCLPGVQDFIGFCLWYGHVSCSCYTVISQIITLQDTSLKKHQIEEKQHHAERKKLRRSAGHLSTNTKQPPKFWLGKRVGWRTELIMWQQCLVGMTY